MSIETNQGKDQKQENLQEQRGPLQQATFTIEGMTCASCSMRVEKGLKKVPGVIDAQVNLASERGTVTYDPQQAEIAQFVQKVEAIGYKATPPVRCCWIRLAPLLRGNLNSRMCLFCQATRKMTSYASLPLLNRDLNIL